MVLVEVYELVKSLTSGWNRAGNEKAVYAVISKSEAARRNAIGLCTVAGWIGWLLIMSTNLK